MTQNQQIVVKLMMAEAQLVAANHARRQATIDFNAHRISGAERGRITAKQTRLQKKVFELRAELNGRVYDLGAA